MKKWGIVYVYHYVDKYHDNKLKKIGMTERVSYIDNITDAAWVRIHEQKNAGNNFGKKEILETFNCEQLGITPYKLEGGLHKHFKNQRIKDPETKQFTEWFEDLDMSDIYNAVSILTGKQHRPNNYKPRREQKSCINSAIKAFQKYDRFLINAVMRFGKTFTSYKIMKKLNAKNVLILSFKTAVKDSWETDLMSHIDFDGYEYFDALELDKNYEMFKNTDKKVTFCSFQDGSDLTKDKFLKSGLVEQKYDLLIVDESHYGSESDKSKNLLKQINFNKRIDLSGTPIKALNSNIYEGKQIFNWSIIDENQEKNKQKNKHPYTDLDLPNINLRVFKPGSTFSENLGYYEHDEYLTLNKFFGATENGFDNVNAVLNWINNFKEDEPRKLSHPFNNKKEKQPKFMFWYLPSVASVKSMRKLLENSWFNSKFNFVTAAGDNDKETNNPLEHVRGTISKSKKDARVLLYYLVVN